jgi:DNA-binding CsgD family transcriptional regulator
VELTLHGDGALDLAARLAGALPELVTGWTAASGREAASRLRVGTRVTVPVTFDDDAESPAGVPTIATAAVKAAPEPPAPEPPTAPVRLYPARRTVSAAGLPLDLTRREYDLLLFLAEHPGRVFTRTQLLVRVWGQRIVSGERTVDVHVRRIRAKLGSDRELITTVRGVGYRLEGIGRVAVVHDAA